MLVTLFDAFRGFVFALIANLDLPVYMSYAIAAEEALLGGQVLPAILQGWWLGEVGLFEQLLVLVHASHFVVFLGLGLVLWYWRRSSFGRFKVSFLVLIYLGLVGYALVPTVPPWMASLRFETIEPIRHVSAEVYNTAIPSLAQRFAVNPIAAMPSLHAGIAALLAMVAVRHFGRRGIPVVIYALLVFVAIGYLGEHYLVDILAGVALAAIVDHVVYRSRLSSLRLRLLEPKADSSLSPLAQSVAVAALLAGICAMVANVRASIATGWSPGVAFAERELVDHSRRGTEFLGLAHLVEGNHEQAAELLSSLPPEEHSRISLRSLALAQFESGRPREAVAATRALRARFPDSPEDLAWQAEILYEYRVIDAAGVQGAIAELERRFPDAAAPLAERLRGVIGAPPPGR